MPKKFDPTGFGPTPQKLHTKRIDDARHVMPPSLRHLKRSVRASIGEAMGGVAMADPDPRMLDYELAPFDYRWTSYAEEYVDTGVCCRFG